jgi:Tol biopolymer transport system component
VLLRLPLLLLTTAGAALLFAGVAAAAVNGNGRIAYARDGAIYTSELDGGHEKQLYAGLAWRPLWSPDGTKLAFQKFSSDSSTSVPVVVDADGSHPRELASGGWYQPVCWAGNAALVATPNSTIGDIYLFDVAGHGSLELTSDLGNKILGPQSCAADGSAVVYTEYSEYTSGLYVVGTDGSAPHEVSSVAGLVGAPAWSPDGKTIAFTRYDGVFTMSASGGAVKRLVAASRASSVAWSPDGSSLAFVSYGGAPCTRFGCPPQIHVVDADGSDERILSNAIGFAPEWSPDGTKLAFGSGYPDEGAAFVANADGTCPTKLTVSVDTRSAFWQPVPGGAVSDPFRCADLSVDVQPGFLDATVGQILPYSITVKNSGNEAAADVIVDEPFAPGFEPLDPNPPQGSCDTSNVGLHCELGRLAPGDTATIYVGDRLRYDGRFTASVHVTSAEPDPFQNDNTDWVTLHVWPCTILGTPGNDLLSGTREPDVVCGREGADRIFGQRGSDVLYGGRGPDTIVGGQGHDVLKGGPGRDVLLARDGARDKVACGEGFDVAVVDRFDRVAADCERVLRR